MGRTPKTPLCLPPGVQPAPRTVQEPSSASASAPPDRKETQALFQGASRAYALMAQALSFGQYLRWRDRLVQVVTRHAPTEPRILDVATGTGLIARRLEETSGGTVTGADLTRDMLRSARSTHRSSRFTRRLVQADALRLPFPRESFDIVTTSYLLRYVEDPELAIARLVDHVRPGGRFGLIEFHVPPHPFVRGLWQAHTRIVLPAGGALAGPGWWKVGRFLGGSIQRFWDEHDLDKLRTMMQKAGLTDIRIETMSLGGGLVAWAQKPSAGARP